MITFFVPGTPVAKGSARAFFRKGMKHPVVVQDNAERQRPWASLISLKAEEAGLRPVAGGVTLTLRFQMPRPKAHFRADGTVKPTFTILRHTKKPDLDKLVRLVKDALKGIGYSDDSEVFHVDAEKFYGPNPGVSIAIEPAQERKEAVVS